MGSILFSRVFGQVGRVLAAALLLGSSPAPAQLLLSEVFYDAIGSDDGWGFVEIAGAPGTDLDGWRVVGINGANGETVVTVDLVGAIAEDGLFLLVDRTSGGTTFTPGNDQVANFDLQNGPDSVQLRDRDRVADALGYGVFGPGTFSFAEGMPAPDVPPGHSLARFFADADSGDNANDFGVLSVPTPGWAVFRPVPEPGTGALVFAGLLVLGARARRNRIRCAQFALPLPTG